MKAFAKALLIIVVIVGAVVGLRFALEDSLLKIDSVEVVADPETHEMVLFERIKKQLQTKVQVFKGKMMWEASLDDVLKFVESDRRVKDISVHRRWPGRLEISILPYKASAILLTSKQQMYPVARDGSLLPKVSSSEAPDVPILRGKNFKSKTELRAKAASMLSELPQQGRFSSDSISEIFYSKKDGFSLSLNSELAQVKLGSEDFRRKSSRIEKVLKYLESEQLQGRVIDARYRKKVVVRLRNEP